MKNMQNFIPGKELERIHGLAEELLRLAAEAATPSSGVTAVGQEAAASLWKPSRWLDNWHRNCHSQN